MQVNASSQLISSNRPGTGPDRDPFAKKTGSESRQRFLGQRTAQLLRLYRTIGKGAYGQMNQYLSRVGDQLRAGGVFEKLSREELP